MAPPRAPEAPFDLPALLNRAPLRLADGLRTVEVRRDRLVVKLAQARRYLVVTPGQWQWLQAFDVKRPVPDVLAELFSHHRCPALHEFYGLVVAAVRQGILLTEALLAPPPQPPARWPVRIPGSVARWLAAGVIAAGVLVLAFLAVPMPRNPTWLVLGWLGACAASSAGYAFAACVVRAGGGEVYRPRLEWLTLAPRFRIDLDDARMVGRGTEADAALARLVPPFLVTWAAAIWCPPLVLPLLVGVLLHLSPLWPSPLLAWLRARFSDPQLETPYDFRVARSRLWALLRRAWRPLADGRFLLACAAATVLWLALVLVTGCLLWRANIVDLLRRFEVAGGFRYVALGLLGLVGALIVVAAAAVALIVIDHLRSWLGERTERRLRPTAAPMAPGTIARLLGQTILFRELSADDLQAVAGAVRAEEHRARSFVVREGEPGDRLYLVVSGRLEVRRDYAPGRSEPVAELVAGDVFGEIALLEGGVRTRSIRCLTRSVLLALGKADFERLVLTRVSRQAVVDAVQKVGFLQHTAWARDWSHATLAAFASRARFQEWKEGDVIIEEGKPNFWFYLVHRGELAVREGDRELRRLTMGDPFGELSVLKGGGATASVVVRSRVASCLVVANTDFLSFLTQDFIVGLRLEELSAQRRGWPALAAGGARGPGF